MDRSGGAGVSGGTRDDGVAFATRLLNGTARPVTGVIVSSLSAGERVRRPRASTAAAAHSSADCSSRMPGQWRVTGTPQPVTLQHSAGAPAGSFFWNTSSAGGKGWKLASGTAYPNGSIAFDYHRVVPAGCSAPACGPPTPTGCVCQFVGAFDVGSCDRFTLNNEHWTRVRRPHNHPGRPPLTCSPHPSPSRRRLQAARAAAPVCAPCPPACLPAARCPSLDTAALGSRSAPRLPGRHSTSPSPPGRPPRWSPPSSPRSPPATPTRCRWR